ncbi:MAG: hypothetical protein L6Q98_04155 [Anaerolineae bacterium]|nr:hypothetical protein [Anaerolineae bacterium]NUQ03827.1 hypothetical protein [Anaerolineae bacterium]
MSPNQSNTIPSAPRMARLYILAAILASVLLSIVANAPALGAVGLLAGVTFLALDEFQTRTGRDVRQATGLALVALVIAAQIAVPLVSHAQATIDFDASDLDVFFDWFNTMFNAILPIGLLGAGIAAGVAFVWVVARMLTKAFTSMLGGMGG